MAGGAGPVGDYCITDSTCAGSQIPIPHLKSSLVKLHIFTFGSANQVELREVNGNRDTNSCDVLV